MKVSSLFTMPVLAVSIASILLFGCVSNGHKFDLGRAKDIQRGKTTDIELQAWFGKPWSVRKHNNGQSDFTWQYTKVETFVGIIDQQVLKVKTDSQGIVSDYTLQIHP